MNFEQSFARGNEEGHAHSKKINNHRTTRVLYFEQSFALSETMHAIRIFNPWFSLKVRNFKSCEKVIARKLLCFPASRVSNRGSQYSTGTSWNSSQASILEVIEYRGSRDCQLTFERYRRSCYHDQTKNYCNQRTKKCVAARGEN